MRRIEQHHVGAVRREGAPAHRAGEYAGEVEYPESRQRPLICFEARQGQGRRIADALDAQQRLRRNRLPLRMRIPFFETAQGGDHQSALGGRLLEFQGPPGAQSVLRIRALRRLRREPQQPQRAVAVMRKIRMHAHPSVRATIQAGKFVPDFRRASIDAEPAGAFERRVQHVDAHVLPRLAARVAQFAGRQGGRRDRRLRGGADGERRRQNGICAGEQSVRQRLGRHLPQLPQPGENFIGVHASPIHNGLNCARRRCF